MHIAQAPIQCDTMCYAASSFVFHIDPDSLSSRSPRLSGDSRTSDDDEDARHKRSAGVAASCLDVSCRPVVHRRLDALLILRLEDEMRAFDQKLSPSLAGNII